MKTHNYIIKDTQLNNHIDFNKFKNAKSILVQVFCGENKTRLKQILEQINKNLKDAICIGTSTDGEIFEKSVTTKKTVISISTFESTTLKLAYSTEDSSFKNGQNLAKELICEDSKLLIVFTDGHKTNGEEFLKGIEEINNSVIIAGGMAGDNAKFQETFICANNQVFTSGAVAVSLNSKTLDVKNSYNFNWSEIGISHTIDEVKDNRVYKISGLKAIDFYKKYLGSYVSKALPATGIEFPLILKKDNLPLARAVINKHNDGSLSFAGNLQKGDKVKLGFGNIELIMNDSIKSLFKDSNLSETQSFFIYSCMARRRYMPNLISHEIEPFSKIASTSGFFTYGEFFHSSNKNKLLNQTLTIVALSEKANLSNNESNKDIKIEKQELSEHSRSLQALTHLIKQSSKDYNEQSKQLEIKSNYAQNLVKAQKQFLKHAVHETNTPLSIIMGNIEMYEMEFGKNNYLSNIEVAMKSLFSIYDDLSYLVKKDQVNQVTKNINIVDFVRSRIEFFSQSAKKAKLKFDFQTSSKDIEINFSETKLQRIVDNNLTNAIKYTLRDETIYVKLEQKSSLCDFSIKSHSKQILDQQKIFEEYYREQNSQEGFGLGLNLVKRICSEENVGIKLESSESWSSFTYTFKGIL